MSKTVHYMRKMISYYYYICISSDHLPNINLYGELTDDKRPVGGPQLRHKDVIKREAVKTNIDETEAGHYYIRY